ncbi:flagellar motor protein [Granulicella aggregans]|jgi:chemotaxis protein MotA|uniref:flagellar motor protein n=1 Tax=Granulicella aggregans TaxID=474949 RepID=UPI0021E07824|nr:flagellar motor protein [Granulicella aggregans]
MNKRRVDKSTLLGTFLAVAGIVGGLVLDGGSVRQILQPSAALIVLAGTLGVILIQFPMKTVIDTFKVLPTIFYERSTKATDTLEEMVSYCTQARRHGILRLDSQLADIEDKFLRKALTFAVDGAHPQTMRENMELELDLLDERELGAVKLLEASGGFAPTLGIMGAVLGLIQVMQRMDNVTEIGRGIAVAFVSTLYGLGLANILLLPLAGKLRIRIRERQIAREMVLEAVLAIMDGMGPRALRERLECYLAEEAVKVEVITRPELAA